VSQFSQDSRLKILDISLFPYFYVLHQQFLFILPNKTTRQLKIMDFIM